MLAQGNPAAQRLSRSELWALLALVLGCRLIALWALPLSDDAFVTFRCARHWAEGLGPVYDPGEAWEPAAGASSTGFAGLLALLLRLGCEPTRAAPALGLLCDLVSARLLVGIFARRRAACAGALFAFALLPALGQIAAGGTGAPLFTLLCLGAVLCAQRQRWLGTGLLAALAVLLRPEGWLLPALLATCVCAGLVAEWSSGRLRARISSDALELVRARAVGCAAVLGLAVYGSLAAARRETVSERVYAPLQQRAIAIGRILPHARILAGEIGALGWAWKGSVLDIRGRAWPLARNYADPLAMIHALRPEYLLLQAGPALDPFLGDPEFRAGYVAEARFPASGEGALLLLRRRDVEDGLGP